MIASRRSRRAATRGGPWGNSGPWRGGANSSAVVDQRGGPRGPGGGGGVWGMGGAPLGGGGGGGGRRGFGGWVGSGTCEGPPGGGVVRVGTPDVSDGSRPEKPCPTGRRDGGTGGPPPGGAARSGPLRVADLADDGALRSSDVAEGVRLRRQQ